MFSFLKKANCIAGVSSTLQSCGMNKAEARQLVEVSSDFFTTVISLTKKITAQQGNIIATISYLELMHSIDPDFPSHLYEQQVSDALKYQLIADSNWKEIGMTFNRVMHLINGEKLMSEREVEDAFEPSRLEIQQ
jgi:hypothetical protein